MFAPGELADLLIDGSEDGFVTDEGRFVTREEAFVIAQKNKQMISHPCADNPEYNKDFYGTKEPSLDSGLIREWAEFTHVGKLALMG
jgi:hypothetical protein